MPKLLTTSPLRDPGSVIPRHRVLLLTLTMTSSLGMVASTIYVPSIPAIAAVFGTSIARVQLTFVGYLLAFAASMLVLGPCRGSEHARDWLSVARSRARSGAGKLPLESLPGERSPPP